MPKLEKYVCIVEMEYITHCGTAEAFSHNDAALKFIKAISIIENGTYKVKVVKMDDMTTIPCSLSKEVQLATK